MADKKRTDWRGKARRLEIEKGELERKNARLQRTIELQKVDSKKPYSIIVYCENCLNVNSCLLPSEMAVEHGDCLTCRVRGRLKIVREVNA